MSNEGANVPKETSSRNSNARKRPAPNSSSDPFTVNPVPDELRLVLLGKTGAGKSAMGNSILGENRFHVEVSMSSVTKECKRECGTVEGRKLLIVDTPGFFDTDLTDEELRQEVIRCLALCSPGPHAFLLVVPIERFTEEQQRTVQMILEMFREDISHYTILIFTHSDRIGEESIREFISRQNAKIQDLVRKFERRFVAFDNTKPTNRHQVRRLLQKVDELLALNNNYHFTNEVTQVMQEAQRIIKESMEAGRLRKIKEEVRKMADVRWRAFLSDMNKERQETERRRKRIQHRIDRIETDITKEEQNVRPIPARLQRFRASLQKELENMRRLEEREMEEERERREREEREQKDLDIWIQEEEKMKLSEAEQNDWFSSDYYIKMLTKLSMFLLGIGASFAPTLLLFLFPAAPAVEVGGSVEFLAKLLGLGAAESGSFFGTAAGVAMKAASVKLAMLTKCCIQ